MQSVIEECRLGADDFADLFGAEPEELSPACREAIEGFPFRYRPLEAAERDRLLRRVIGTLNSREVSAAGESRHDDWETGWSENLKAFEESGYDTATLVPKYFKKREAIRLRGDYVLPMQEDFYLRYTEIFREWLLRKWFSDVPAIAEFGCGSGAHIAAMTRLFPGKPILGLDWAAPSQEILARMAQELNVPVAGRRFDFFTPDDNLELTPGCGVLTFGALEQVGDRFGPFLDFLGRQEIGVCVHVEGFLELYREEDLLDHLAAEYHRKRNYLNGLLPALQEQERRGAIEILDVHHNRAGVLFNDTYSQVVWRPR